MPIQNTPAPGFHLIEILLSLVIMGLLAAISIPTYTQYFTHERRLEAESQLAKLAVMLEQYHMEYGSYQGATLPRLHLSEWIVNNHYQLLILNTSENSFLLAAKPQGTQAVHDAICGTLGLNAENEKQISGNGSIEDCW